MDFPFFNDLNTVLVFLAFHVGMSTSVGLEIIASSYLIKSELG